MFDDLFCELVADLRRDDGMMLRRVLKVLREKDDPETRDLYVTLIQHPELYDLVPN
jgi:hypothetical protein